MPLTISRPLPRQRPSCPHVPHGHRPTCGPNAPPQLWLNEASQNHARIHFVVCAGATSTAATSACMASTSPAPIICQPLDQGTIKSAAWWGRGGFGEGESRRRR